ncbi:hypothetical protein MasN3_35020 [Massilia varians]|uniref:Uncharacterized protein n=1 Tax=Massilia varians TaxID=457921 RepID=A0ABN6TF63_9BURK|nr:hypothetical protein [Massilia varians]BDT60008.1 hypothetical protein MasN3_35020 [Massilia varians]
MFFLHPLFLIQRANILSLIVAATMTMLPSAHASDSIERRVTGEWKFTAALDGAEISSLDEREAQRLLGQVFTIRKDKVRFGKMDCGETQFEAQKVEPRLHLREEFHASSKELRLPDPVTVVDLSCTSVFITKPNHLVIFWQGWFFDAVRVKK